MFIQRCVFHVQASNVEKTGFFKTEQKITVKLTKSHHLFTDKFLVVKGSQYAPPTAMKAINLPARFRLFGKQSREQ